MTNTPRPSPNLYRRHFTRAERRHLREFSDDGLAGEIYLLRVMLARNFGALAHSSSLAPSQQLTSLRARAHAASLIAALLRTQIITSHPASPLDLAIQEALAEVRASFGID